MLVPYHGYQATYSVASPPPPVGRRQRRSARARFLHAFVFAGLALVLLHVVAKHARYLRNFVHDRLHGEPDSDMSTGSGDHRSCEAASWTFDPEGRVPVDQFLHVAEASFELPASADLLFFKSKGAATFAHGVIEIDDSGTAGADVVKVDITAHYNDVEDFLEHTKACLLHPREGEDGVGIFAPMHWVDRDTRRKARWDLKVRLPASSSGSSREIKKLVTDMPMFLHQVGDIGQSMFFDILSLHTSNMPVHVRSLTGDIATVKTSNGPISGRFNTSHYLELHTSNSPVKVDVGLLSESDDERTPTKLSIKSSNGPVAANLSMYATTESETGGQFLVGIRTSNSPTNIAVLDAPVDHTLHLKAHTSNSFVQAALHKTYEGAFRLTSSRFFRPTIHASDVQDPADKGRRRVIETSRATGGYLEGAVHWRPTDRKTRYGSVDISTSNLGLDLSLPA